MINPQDPPQRRWVESSVGHHGPERIGGIALQIVHNLQGSNPDEGLAMRILAYEPNYLYGANASNARIHALWALMVLGRDDELPVLLEPIRVACNVRLNMRVAPQIPGELLLMTAYANVRIGRVQDAKIAIVLANRGVLTTERYPDLLELVGLIPPNPTPFTTPFL